MTATPAADSPPTAKRQTLKWGGHFGFSSTCWATECLQTRITDSFTGNFTGFCCLTSFLMRPEVPLLVLAEQHAGVQRGCIETLTEDERKKLNGFLLECHRTQKRKSRYPTVYAGSADIFRAKRRQRKFALLQQKAPTVETERSAKLRKGEDPKKLSDDKKQAAVARAASPAAASPAKCPSPESLPDVNLEASANQQSLEKENAATDGARQDDEQHQQVETPKRLESMTKDEKAKEDEERSTPKAPSLPPQEATDTRKAADELSGNQQSVAASGHSQPRRVEANHEAPIKVQNASFCEAEPHEVNGAEKEAQRRQQSARRRKIRKKHANLKQVKKEERQEKQKHIDAASEKDEGEPEERDLAPQSHSLASKEKNRKRAKSTSARACEANAACRQQQPKGSRKALNPLRAAWAAAAALQARQLEEEMKRLALCNGRRRSCVLVSALQSHASL